MPKHATESYVGAAVTALDLGTRFGTKARPSGDLTCTSTTTLADWTGFSIAVTAGRTYEFDGIAFYSGDPSGDGRFGATCPSGTLRIAGAALSASASSLPGAVQTSDVVDASGEYITLGCISGARHAVAFSGTFVCTSSGTVQFQGAQNSSLSTATVFQATGTRVTYTSFAT